MSLDPLSDRTTRDKENEIARVAQSRKRKLCELYAVAASPDPVPRRHELHPIFGLDNLQSPPSPLALFLDQNDLTTGNYFDPSTLPPRTYNAFSFAKQFSEPSGPLEPTSSLGETRSDPSPSQGAEGISPQPPPPPTKDKIAPAEPTSNVPIDDSQTHERSKLGSDVPPLVVAERPGPEVLVNGKSKDQDTHRRRLSTQEEKQPEKLRPPELQTTWAESASSPSSTAGLHSNNTSRVDGHSPDTSPDEDGTQEISKNQSESMNEKNPADFPTPSHDSNAGSQHVRRESQPGEDICSKSETRSQENEAPKSEVRGQEVAKSPRTVVSNNGSQTDAVQGGLHNTPSPEAADQDQERRVQNSPTEDNQVEHREAGTRDDLATQQHSQIAEGRNHSNAEDSGAYDSTTPQPGRRKRRRLSGEPKETLFDRTTAVVLREVPDRRLNILTSIAQKPGRIPDARVPTTKKDYMHILFLRQALDQSFKTDLSSTLASSAKTLVTSDYQASLSEKQDCAVVKRIYELQQNRRWILRQFKPSPEPAVPHTHQNSLLSEMRWLRTDFREERKAKLFMAKQLAEWCEEWVLSNPAKRAALRNGPVEASESSSDDEDDRPPHDPSPTSSPPSMAIEKRCDVLSLFDSRSCPDSGQYSHRTGSLGDNTLVSHIPTCTLGLDEEVDAADAKEILKDGFLQAALDCTERHGKATTMSRSDAPFPPEDTKSALFHPESEQMKKRLNAPGLFKLPVSQMPSQSFYELRTASQWTAEDDHNLRTCVRDCSANWELVADRMAGNSRSTLIPATQRRTPWECYERLLQLESQVSETGSRHFAGPAGQFQRGLEKIKLRYIAQQQMLQHSQSAGQMTIPPSSRPFPLPIRVERKPALPKFKNGLIDAARRLARKREQALGRQPPVHPDSNAHGQRLAHAIPREAPHSPGYYSKLKYERHLQETRAHYRQQRLYQAQRQQQQSGNPNQPLYQSGIAQRMGNHVQGPSSTTATTNGHLAVPGSNHARSQGANGIAAGMSQNMPSSSQVAQVSIAGRPPSSMHGHQRLAPPYPTNPSSMNEHSIQHLMQQAHQQPRNPGPYQNGRPSVQNQYGHGSPNMGSSMSGIPNASMAGPYNGYPGTGAGQRSPEISQVARINPAIPSPEVTHSLPASNSMQYHSSVRQQSQSQPSTLSSGHVPTVHAVQHQIAQQNPHLSNVEVEQRASTQLKQMIDQSRLSAINAAAGSTHGAKQHQHHNPNSTGAHPFTNQASNSQSSPVMQNGIASSNNATPTNAMQYHQQMQRQMQQMNSARNATAMASPAMSHMGVQPYHSAPTRTPTPGQHIRPPSSSGSAYAGMNMSLGRMEESVVGPGSISQQLNGVVQSPRPPSAQGVQQ